MSKSLRKNSFLVAVVSVSALLSACAPNQEDLSKMKVSTQTRKPTKEEIEVARAKTANQNSTDNTANLPTTRTTTTRSVDTPSTIAGVDEALALAEQIAKKFGLARLNLNGAIIAQVGKVAWKILEKNQAVVSLDQARISLLPDVKDWRRLGGWRTPKVKAFTVLIKNPYGMKVVQYDYAIAYDYGGSVDGKGQYLMNLTVINSKISVMWGFNLSAEFVTYDPTNRGNSENPVPAVTGEVRWKVKNILTNIRQSNAFWVAGDGSFKTLNNADQAQ